MKLRTVVLILVAMVVGVSLVAWAGLDVKSDKKNIVAGRIKGEWAPHKKLSKRLMGDAAAALDNITFRIDTSVAKKIPDKYDEFFKGRQVYTAGTLKLRGKEYPFVLIALGGCPHVVYFREKGGEPMGDAESFYVMLAAAKDKAKDILFVGGDMPSESFTALERAAK